jgi:hypothetical protein
MVCTTRRLTGSGLRDVQMVGLGTSWLRDNGHSGYAKPRERAGQLLRRRYERMVREGEI